MPVVEPIAAGLLSVLAVSLISLIGAAGIAFRRIYDHGVMMVLVALAAGTLVGDALLHLLPEAAAERGFTTEVGAFVLLGFLFMFVMEVGLRWRHAHIEEADVHAHGRHEGHEGHDGPRGIAPFGWMNLISDGVHNLLDGAVIMAAFLVDVHLGIATAIAVAMHEIPQELGDFAVLLRSGMGRAQALLFNLASAMVALIGAGIVAWGGIDGHDLEIYGLPFIAGAFIYIAAADLVPELHHHTKGKDGLLIFAGLVAGLALMWWLVGFEGSIFGADGHDHGSGGLVDGNRTAP